MLRAPQFQRAPRVLSCYNFCFALPLLKTNYMSTKRLQRAPHSKFACLPKLQTLLGARPTILYEPQWSSLTTVWLVTKPAAINL